MTLYEKTIRRESTTDKYDSLQEAYMKVFEASPQHMSNKLAKILKKDINYHTNIKGYGYGEKEGLYAYADDKKVMEKLAKDMEQTFKIKTKMEKIGNSWVVLQSDKEASFGLKNNIKNPIFKESVNENEEYSDDDWVLVADRKALKFYKNPKNDKAPRKAYNDMNNSSKVKKWE